MGRMIAIAGVVLGLLLARPTRVRAGELQDFQFAEMAYDAGDYRAATQRFEALLPSLTSELLLRRSRLYLAASYVHLGDRSRAARYFRELLRADEDFVLEEHLFSAAVVSLFNEVRAQVEQERRQRALEEQHRQEQLRQLEIDQMLRQRERMQRLEDLARQEVVERPNSRGLALLPFGVGQFRNGERALGIGLAVTESVLAAGSIATWAWHRWLVGREVAPDERLDFNDRERVARISNQVVTSAFAAVALAGILEAQMRFKPVLRHVRHRDLPDDLPALDPQPGPDLEIGLGFGSAHLQLSF